MQSLQRIIAILLLFCHLWPVCGCAAPCGELIASTVESSHGFVSRQDDGSITSIVLDCAGAAPTGAFLKCVGKQVQLKELRLVECDLANGTLRYLTKLHSLNALVLEASLITSNDIAYISELPSLAVLSLAHTRVDDDSMRFIVKMHELRSLDVSGTEVSEDGIMELANMKQLRTINAYGIVLSEEVVASVREHGIHMNR